MSLTITAIATLGEWTRDSEMGWDLFWTIEGYDKQRAADIFETAPGEWRWTVYDPFKRHVVRGGKTIHKTDEEAKTAAMEALKDYVTPKVDPQTQRLRQLEFERGEADAKAGHPPVTLGGAYFDGYLKAGGKVPTGLREHPAYCGCRTCSGSF